MAQIRGAGPWAVVGSYRAWTNLTSPYTALPFFRSPRTFVCAMLTGEMLKIPSLHPANSASRGLKAGPGARTAAFIIGPRPLQAPPPCTPRPALALTCRSSQGGCRRPVGRQCWSSSEPSSTWAWLSSPVEFCTVCSYTLVVAGSHRTRPARALSSCFM